MLTPDQAIAQARDIKTIRESERAQLDLIRRYWKGVQRLPAVIPSSAPREVRTMARIARVNVCKIVIDSLAQACFVDNFRSPGPADVESDNKVWDIWQANKLDARQTGIHRAAFAYGAAYAIVTPGTPLPVIRGVSPRQLTAVYGDDPDWPEFALEYRGNRAWRLYDNSQVYELRSNQRGSSFDFVSASPHGADVTPVIRYLSEDDLDADDDVTVDQLTFVGFMGKPLRGEIGQLIPIQDQIDLSTFGLKVAEWYSAFKQRWAIGWVPDDEMEKMNAAASQLWTFDEDPEKMKLGEFTESNLTGYIESRESSLRHAATLSQTPAHELIGELVNLSAEALVAAEQGHERKVGESQTLFGESHEQTLRLAAKLANINVDEDAEVVWRDTSARAFSATVDALGKLSKMLAVPVEELWARIPGVTRQDIERWKASAESGDAFAELTKLLEAETNSGAKVIVAD